MESKGSNPSLEGTAGTAGSTRYFLKQGGLLGKQYGSFRFSIKNVPENAIWDDTRMCLLHETDNSRPYSERWLDALPFCVVRDIITLAEKSYSYEDILTGKIVYDGTGDRERKIQEKLKRRIACKAITPRETNRQDSICLVLGPSGSGKTTYCLKESIHNSDHEFRVYMYADVLTGELNQRIKTFREILHHSIHSVLKREANIERKLEMHLYAIIDEAGCDPFYGNKENLIELSNVVKEFATHGQLVVSGTGLDLLTTSIGSAGEGITKIRLLPWELADFAKLTGDNNIVNLVRKHDVYTKLVSNARAATRLLHWIESTQHWGDSDENVAHVVSAVAYDYISGNSLKDANTNTRRKIVRAVLKHLDRCKYKSPTIPEFDEDPSGEVLNKAQSLVDVHVEKNGNNFSLNDGHDYAVSITPAITIVLVALLRNRATLQSCWSGFESIVALDELFRLVREESADEMPSFEIVKLDKPYGAKASIKNMEVPVMTRSTVLINGPNASYADVIAWRRLIQVKHCQSSGATVNLFIEEELRKMGLLTDSSLEQRVFAVAQYEVWLDGESSKNSAQPQSHHLHPALYYGQQFHMGQHRGGAIGYNYGGYNAQFGGVQGNFAYPQPGMGAQGGAASVYGHAAAPGAPYDDHHSAGQHGGGSKSGGYRGGGGRNAHHSNSYGAPNTSQYHAAGPLNNYGGQPYGIGHHGGADHFNQTAQHSPYGIPQQQQQQSNYGDYKGNRKSNRGAGGPSSFHHPQNGPQPPLSQQSFGLQGQQNATGGDSNEGGGGKRGRGGQSFGSKGWILLDAGRSAGSPSMSYSELQLQQSSQRSQSLPEESRANFSSGDFPHRSSTNKKALDSPFPHGPNENQATSQCIQTKVGIDRKMTINSYEEASLQPAQQDVSGLYSTDSDQCQPSEEASPQPTQPDTRGLYPASLLIPGISKEKPVCRHYSKCEGHELWYRTDSRLMAMEEIDRSNMPMTVVFATNGAEFKICSRQGRTSIDHGKYDKNCCLFDGKDGSPGSGHNNAWTKQLRSKLVPGVIVELAFAKS